MTRSFVGLAPPCVAVVWLPGVLLGVLSGIDVPGLAGREASSVLVRMIERHSPELLAGLFGAGVFFGARP